MIVKSKGILLDGDKILLIRRYRYGKTYYTMPGGRQEEGESLEECLIREMKEETNYDVELGSKLYEVENKLGNSLIHIYSISKYSGELRLGGPELKRCNQNNQYILEWVDVSKIPSIDLFPDCLKEKIIEYFKK